jgi:GNAT superfamily N-acetyltransferase
VPELGDLLFRAATADDAQAIIDNTSAGIESYREWAPPTWTPPQPPPDIVERFRARLSEDHVWILTAWDGPDLAGHVSLSRVTGVNPEPAPPGVSNIWQMFVRRPWQGRGLASELMAAAVAEAGRRRYQRLRLWTPEGAAQARRFYEREGWTHRGAVRHDAHFGLPLVEYQREVPPQPPS